MSDITKDFSLKIGGELGAAEGVITGKGSIKLELPTTNFKLSYDYSGPDKTILSIQTEKDIKVDFDKELKLYGGLSHELNESIWSGNVGIKIVINKNASVKFEQMISSDGLKTVLGFEVAI